MDLMNNNANIKQFKLVKFVNENSSDNVMSKISIVLRRDKIEAPYYMDTKIRMTSCIDRYENGLIHAMDILNHHRMYNLSEKKFNEIKSMIDEASFDRQAKIFKKEKKLKIVLMTKNAEEFRELFNKYHELFDKIDKLCD